MTDVPLRGLRSEAGRGVVDGGGMNEFDENGYGDELAIVGVSTEIISRDRESHLQSLPGDVELARAVMSGAAGKRDGPARGRAALSELIESVDVDCRLIVL